MDAKLKSKWLKALRGGRYKQGAQKLYRDGKYCCLGVLCRVQGATLRNGELFLAEKPARVSSEIELLRDFARAGMKRKTQTNLANMNDGSGKWAGMGQQTFRQIAGYIEANL